MEQLIPILIGFAVGFFLFKRFLISRVNYKAIMDRGAVIIDVRTPQEYDNGHINGSINIPLNNINARAEGLKQKNVPIICVCASGMRSGSATSILKRAGVESYNGGNWSTLGKKI